MIYVTGDTHIPLDIGKLNIKKFPKQKEMNHDDYVVVLGDFGLFWKNDKTYGYWKKWLEEKLFTLLWLDGNHENHEWINSLPVSQWHGGNVHQTSENIIHLMRGQLYDINGSVFLAAGGAQSYDRGFRKPYVSWWPEELWNYTQQAYMFHVLGKMREHKANVDYVLSHTCPTELIYPMFNISPKEDPDPTTDMLQDVLEYIGYNNIKDWYFGHWHQDKDYGKFHCLYNEIRRIG